MTATLDPIARSRVVAVVRARSASLFVEVGTVLAEAGVTCIEFTLSSEGAVDALRAFAAQLPRGVAIGAGTVLDAESASAAVDAGATYLISPALCRDVIERGADLGVPVIPGALTPTEILDAWRAGASAVKVFPVAEAGGPAYIRAVLAPLPDVPLIPTGGVEIDDASDYLAAGAFAVGLGGSLIGDASAGGDLGALRARAQALVAAVGVATA